MAKTDKDQTAEDECKVVEVLRTHAKDSADAIAKRCKLSPQKVSRIIAKLEREKRIWGYSAILEDEYFGFRHYYMMVDRSSVPLPKEMIAEVLFRRLDNITPASEIVIENIEYVNGPCDGVFSFFAKDITDAKRFMETFNKRFHPYIKNLFLLESIYTVRRRGIRNPNIKKTLNLPLVDDSVNIKDIEDNRR